MFWLFAALFSLLVVSLAALAMVAYFWWLKEAFHEADASDEIHFVRTDDGARLALYRYRPRGTHKRSLPVFFCHGLGASKYNLDFDDTYSWARLFAKAGFDAWVVDLRGAGLSTPPKKWDWCFDDYARHDVPAVLDHIRQQTNAPRVHWVGHSMGGMLLYAVAGSFRPGAVQSAVTVGSPVGFSRKKHLKGLLNLTWLLDHVRFVPVRTLTRLTIPLMSVMPHNPVSKAQYNPHNVDTDFMKRVAYNAVEHLPPALLKQFEDWVSTDTFRSLDKSFDYKEGIANIYAAVLVIAGATDFLVSAESTKLAFDLLPSADKKYIMFGKEFGYSMNYGHVDLVFGTKALEEVFPHVLNWIIDHEPVAGLPA